MKRHVKFLIKADEGEVVSVTGTGRPYAKLLQRGSDMYRDPRLVLSFNPESGKGSLGDCIVRPDDYKWGAFESGDGVVLMRFDFHVGWLFWAGTYPNGKSIKPCVRFSDAIRYSKAKAMVALAILNVDKKEMIHGE
tara:strand:- start:8551 stop:8958 length:408 start_codon:yes stop_codon:yes gene_type:complete